MLQKFLESSAGIAVVVGIIILAMVILSADLHKKRIFSIKAVTYSSICIALAFILSYIKYPMPFGGSITPCSMFFICLVGYWFGPVSGIMAGFTYGLLQLAVDPYVIHPVQMLLDYPLAFGALGLSGFFRKGKHSLQTGYIVGVFGRFLFSSIAGYIFFAQYAPETMNLLVYTVSYNLTYMGVEAAITLVLVSIPAFRIAVDRFKNDLNNNTNPDLKHRLRF